MEINVQEMISRLDLQHIRAFALEELPDPIAINSGTYSERLKEGNKFMMDRLKNICGNDEELDNATNDFLIALSAYSDVYAEIGIKIGARLLFQLLCKND